MVRCGLLNFVALQVYRTFVAVEVTAIGTTLGTLQRWVRSGCRKFAPTVVNLYCQHRPRNEVVEPDDSQQCLVSPPGGFEASQAASPIEATIQIDDAHGIVFEDCEIGHTGE